MDGFELTKSQVKGLKLLHKRQRDRRLAYRINAIILLGTGWRLTEVSDALLLDTETLRSYVKKYRDGKVQELLKNKQLGKQSRLSDQEQTELKAHLSEFTYPDIKSIIAYVKKTYEATYGPTQMRNILKALNFTYKKPKLVPGRSDVIASMDFLETYKTLRDSEKPLYFMDGVHPQHNSKPSYGWIQKGETKALLSNTGRKRLNINGAINIDTKDILVTVGDSVNAQSTIKLFKKIIRRHKNDDKIYIVCDNAAYYRSRLVTDFILEAEKIELVFLPPYSPFLNLIERVWKYFNKIVLYNKYYPVFSDFKAACLDFFKRKHKRALDKKLVEKFHFSDKIITILKCST